MESKIGVFLVGAQKAGTTSLYDWLGQHPEIDAPPQIKDHHVFTSEDFFDKAPENLERFYRNGTKYKLHGAVNYLYFSELAAKRIYQYNPQAKVIICLRNPVDRAISAYKYFTRTLRESSSFRDALAKEISGDLRSYQELANNTYISHGFYFDQICDYLKYFKKEQINIVLFDEINAAPERERLMRQLCEFIGCQPDYRFSYSRLNASGKPKSKLLNYMLRKSPAPSLFKLILPFRIRKAIGKTISQWNISESSIEVDIENSDINRLEEIYQNRNRGLHRVLVDKFKLDEKKILKLSRC